VLRVQLLDARSVRSTKEVAVVVDLDESNVPCGIEILGLRSLIGAMATILPVSTADPEAVVRSSYDSETDAAVIGAHNGYGTRVVASVPLIAQVNLDGEGRFVSLLTRIS
jgi:hypothetical protein